MLIGRRKPLTSAQQFVNLRGNPVCRGEGVLRAGQFTWCCSAMPSPLSRDYVIRIEFRQGGRPQIFVDGPDLHLLYRPKTYEWQSWMRLDQTVVPWATLWLFYFEEWLVSDEWKGGGMHPECDDDHDCGEAA
jgi:hypothetical protein